MTASVVPLFDGVQAEGQGVPVAQVCDAAKEACEEIVVLGYSKGDGKLYVASSFSQHSAERTIWLMEQCKRFLIGGCRDEDSDA